MDELRAFVRQSPDLRALGGRLLMLLSKADYQRVMEALEKGDMDEVFLALGASEQELQGLFHSLKAHASKLAEQYPDLADFARAMRATRSL